MTEIAPKPKPVPQSPANRYLGFPAVRLASVVDRTSELSADVLKSLEDGERSAVDAVGQFVITLEEVWPQRVIGTSDVAKKITVSGLEMTDRLIQTEYEFLRNLIDSAAKSLSSHEEAVRKAA